MFLVSRISDRLQRRMARIEVERKLSLGRVSLDRNGSYNYYVSEQIGSDSFMGVTPLLLAALEMERLP
jgi:rhamnogalacturonyl hydrolase YesR